MSLGLKLRK